MHGVFSLEKTFEGGFPLDTKEHSGNIVGNVPMSAQGQE